MANYSDKQQHALFGDTNEPYNESCFDKLKDATSANNWKNAVAQVERHLDTYFAKCANEATYLYWGVGELKRCNLDELRMRLTDYNYTYIDKTVQRFNPLEYVLQRTIRYHLTVDPSKSIVSWRDVKDMRYINLLMPMLHANSPRAPVAVPSADLQFVLDHIKYVWCDDNLEQYDYAIMWFASIAQGRRAGSTLYLTSAQGAGKSIITNFMQFEVFGRGNTLKLNGLDAFMKSPIVAKTLVIIEELRPAIGDSNGEFASRLKSLATDPEIDGYANTTSTIIFSNHDAIRFEESNRRIVQLTITPAKIGQSEYFARLGGIVDCQADPVRARQCGAEMFAYLRAVDCSTYSPMKIPMTEPMLVQKVAAMDPVFVWIRDNYVIPRNDLKIFNDDIASAMNAADPTCKTSGRSVGGIMFGAGFCAADEKVKINASNRRGVEYNIDALCAWYASKQWL